MNGVVRRSCLTLLVVCAACGPKRPPEDFAPDPGLAARVQGIEMSTTVTRACPGAVIPTSYLAVLDDGSRLPFSRTYDPKRPPALHVMFLERTSPQAASQADGDWVTASNSLLSLIDGFRLRVAFRFKPSVVETKVIPPSYDCGPRAFRFQGRTGEEAGAGADGPDVTVRLGIVRSPFYDSLIVAGIEAGDAPPFYVFGDAATMPPADWLLIETRGGRGGRGQKGTPGAKGGKGQPGCPSGDGGQGGNGGRGGQGGPGGRGGRVTIIVPRELPFVAGLVDAETTGGEGGPGGPGGDPGGGGDPGDVRQQGNEPCTEGKQGPSGARGEPGPDGRDGREGPRSQVITLPMREVFGPYLPAPLAELVFEGMGRRE